MKSWGNAVGVYDTPALTRTSCRLKKETNDAKNKSQTNQNAGSFLCRHACKPTLTVRLKLRARFIHNAKCRPTDPSAPTASRVPFCFISQRSTSLERMLLKKYWPVFFLSSISRFFFVLLLSRSLSLLRTHYIKFSSLFSHFLSRSFQFLVCYFRSSVRLINTHAYVI